MKQSGESIYPRYIKFQVELENMKFKNTTLKTKQESLVNVNDQVFKFRIARTTKPAFDRFLQVKQKTIKERRRQNGFILSFLTKKKIDEKVAIKLI